MLTTVSRHETIYLRMEDRMLLRRLKVLFWILAAIVLMVAGSWFVGVVLDAFQYDFHSDWRSGDV